MARFFSNKWTRFLFWLNKVNIQEMRGRVLCVDDDPDFCLYLERLAHSMGLQLDKAYTIAEAKQKIEENQDYQAFLIDGHLPDGSGFELVAWIRKKKTLPAPIGFLSRIYQDAASFRMLKETLNVNYVLEKPIQPDEVKQLLMKLCHFETESLPAIKPFPDDVLAELRENYRKSIFDKVERLEKMILTFQKSPTSQNLQTLKGEVHKIAGSAGSYGYLAVSEICRKLEMDLNQQIELEKEGKLDQHLLLSLDDFYTKVKLAFQIEPTFEGDEGKALRSRHLTSVYVVDEDQTYLDLFKHPAVDRHFDILTEIHPENAIQTLLSSDFYPQILLLDAHYPKALLTGYDLIKAFYKQNDYLTTTLGLVVENRAIEDQVEALKRGISYILDRSLNVSFLLPLLDQVPFRALPLSYKVLIIDADPDICHYIHQTLNFTDLTLKSITETGSLEKVLAEYLPDLILLDINLKDQSGVRILERLRKDFGYEKLLLGMIMLSHEETHLIHECYEMNVDQILFKPLEGGVLQKKIVNSLKKQTDLLLESAKDSMTGLANAQTLQRYLEKIRQEGEKGIYQSHYVVFEIDGFTILMDQSHKISAEGILKEVSQALEDILQKYELAAYLGNGRFGLVFKGVDSHFVQLLMKTFLERLQIRLRDLISVEKSIYLNCAIILLDKGDNVEVLQQRCEDAIKGAKQQSQQTVRLSLCDKGLSGNFSKQVILLHDESEDFDFLRILFNKHDFKTAFLTSIDEDFHLLYQGHSSIVPPLLILTGTFAEVKGALLLKKIIQQNKMQLSVIALDGLSDAGDLSQLLAGVNYFDYPFHLVVCICH